MLKLLIFRCTRCSETGAHSDHFILHINRGYDLLPKEKSRIDVYYIEHRSLRMDWSIIWKTVRTMISGEGAR